MPRKHGLTEAFTILVSAGGFGVGPVEHITGSLELTHPAQVVASADDEAEAPGSTAAARKPPTSRGTVQVLGFTTEIDELMAAADSSSASPAA